MIKIKFKVMFSVLSYFILNFIIVYSFDIENVQYTRKRYNRDLKGICDLHATVNQQEASFNYNDLFKKEGYSLKSGDKIFYLNVCGNAPQCGRNIAVCYKNNINSRNVNNIGLSTDITLAHEAIRYKFSRGKKTQIKFICDRHVKEPNITYDKDSKYTFKFVTSKACYPKPTECVFNDKYNYNISSLHRNYDNWVVSNVPNSNSSSDFKIYLNICGKFNSIPNLRTDSDCFYDGTQICLVYKDGNSRNLGVFSDTFQYNDNDSVSLSIKGGSLCSDSNSILTNIEFSCSIDEFGPVLVSNSNCEYNIIWKTPAVCPHRINKISNCKFKDFIYGSRKMKLSEEIIHLNSTAIVKYNICDRISCNGEENVHFCLVNMNNNNETIIGGSYDNKLVSIDGLLAATYHGDNCSSSSVSDVKNRVNVQLTCDYTKHKLPAVNTSEDSCVTNITMYTNEACTDAEPNILDEQCSTSLNKSGIMYYYNISQLRLTDRNYQIKDESDPNVVYILNVCQPILFRAGTHCDSTAIVCMRNDSIGNIYKKSKTLGHYQFSKLVVLHNDSLAIEFAGSMCAKRMGINYFAKIEFICNSEAQDTHPILVSNTDCEYYFKWETLHACPFTNDTLQTKVKDIVENNITSIKPIKNDENVQESSVLKMKHTTISTTTTTTTSTTSTSTTTTSTTSTTTTLPPKQDLIINKIMETTEVSTKIPSTSLIVPIDVQVSNTSAIYIKNCTFEDFNMFTLPRNMNLTSKTGRLYSLNICNLPKSHDCRVDNCLSKLKMDSSNKFIEMDFYGKTKCQDGYFNSVIYIKCSEKSSQPSVIKEEACGVEFEWKNSAVCALLREKPKNNPNEKLESHKSGHMTTIILSVFVFLIILCASVFISIHFWRKRQVHSSPSCLARCEYSKIKDSSKIV